MELSTIFISLVSSLCVVGATEAIKHLKDSRSYQRERKKERFEAIQTLFAERMASFEKSIRRTIRLEDYSALYDELPLLNARFGLRSPRNIIDQSELVGDLLEQWSSQYRQGSPKKLGDTGAAIISSHDGPHREKAKELYPKLLEESNKLYHMMQEHLKAIEA
jgi:hypothetical protein